MIESNLKFKGYLESEKVMFLTEAKIKEIQKKIIYLSKLALHYSELSTENVDNLATAIVRLAMKQILDDSKEGEEATSPSK